jgi:hypothetical protein
MKVLFKLLWILLIAGILEACNASGRLEYALECAATNKGELEKVLEHYKDEPEKYKAACFLIENIPPKGVSFSDFICIFAMPDEVLFDYFFATLS